VALPSTARAGAACCLAAPHARQHASWWTHAAAARGLAVADVPPQIQASAPHAPQSHAAAGALQSLGISCGRRPTSAKGGVHCAQPGARPLALCQLGDQAPQRGGFATHHRPQLSAAGPAR
jgi:hypothetical protein